MPSTYTLIKGETLASDVASYTFSAIAADWTDLVIRCSTRNAQSSNYPAIMRVRFNSDTSLIYSGTYVYGQDGTAGSFNESNADRIGAYGSNGNTSTSNTFSNIEIYIPSYLASQNKPVSVSGVAENNAANFGIVAASAGLYRSTTAITSITLSNVNNLLTGSSFYLYGIKKS